MDSFGHTTMEQCQVVRILHISDTHGLHRTVEDKYPMPDADVLIHTGDFTDKGSLEEFHDFNEWLGELQKRYPHRILILGNHEYKAPLDPQQAKTVLSNAIVLEHESVDVLGLHMFGSPWIQGHKASAPGDSSRVPHKFDQIPQEVDILLTHGSPFGIMDYCELGSMPHWGGSKALRQEILRASPRVHLFGHMHEQRGVWHHRPGLPFSGGIEYDVGGGQVHPTHAAPPPDYPCELISCNAMKNHPNIDRACGKSSESCIAGPARLIVAERPMEGDRTWRFHLGGNTIGYAGRTSLQTQDLHA